MHLLRVSVTVALWGNVVFLPHQVYHDGKTTRSSYNVMLFRGHENKKLLRAGKHPKESPTRTKEQVNAYKNTLEKILQTMSAS